MQVTWIAAPDSAPLAAALGWSEVTIRHCDGTPAREMLHDSAVLIVEVGAEPGSRAGGIGTELGFALLEKFRDALPVWVLDVHATVGAAVRWMKSGASHVAAGPEEIRDRLRSLDDDGPARPESRMSILGNSPAIRSVEADVRLVANRRCNVLIEGETGTGKEVVGRRIHEAGDRSREPWVAVNCSAIPETLLEAELFGHVRGAFTGAIQSRAGKFEAAGRGTIFLDEIGDMPLATQAKLLRVLQEREIERLGGNERIRLDVRVIAATNANLAQRVQEGLFREDLFYRLNVFRLSLPPLRARSEDIPALAQHFVDRFCAQERFPRKTLDRFAVDRLRAHNWPGNVRELENTMESAVIISGMRATIFPSDLRLTQTAPPPKPARSEAGPELPAHGINYQLALEEFEKNLLAQALTRARGNKSAAADLLGLKRTTLAAKMKVLGARAPRMVA